MANVENMGLDEGAELATRLAYRLAALRAVLEARSPEVDPIQDGAASLLAAEAAQEADRLCAALLLQVAEARAGTA